jgi:hypothetical protein
MFEVYLFNFNLELETWNLEPYQPNNIPGDYGEGEPPVPIPNTAVKPLRANGTCRATGWESRSSPGAIFNKKPVSFRNWLFVVLK